MILSWYPEVRSQMSSPLRLSRGGRYGPCPTEFTIGMPGRRNKSPRLFTSPFVGQDAEDAVLGGLALALWEGYPNGRKWWEPTLCPSRPELISDCCRRGDTSIYRYIPFLSHGIPYLTLSYGPTNRKRKVRDSFFYSRTLS